MRVLPVVALLALLLPAARPAAGEGQRVAVYRGSASNVAARRPGLPGQRRRPGYGSAGTPGPEVGAVGGQRLWFVDPGRDELVACRMVRTFTVGVERIRCARRRLPAG